MPARRRVQHQQVRHRKVRVRAGVRARHAARVHAGRAHLLIGLRAQEVGVPVQDAHPRSASRDLR